jgi:hypothetical protein
LNDGLPPSALLNLPQGEVIPLNGKAVAVGHAGFEVVGPSDGAYAQHFRRTTICDDPVTFVNAREVPYLIRAGGSPIVAPHLLVATGLKFVAGEATYVSQLAPTD